MVIHCHLWSFVVINCESSLKSHRSRCKALSGFCSMWFISKKYFMLRANKAAFLDQAQL